MPPYKCISVSGSDAPLQDYFYYTWFYLLGQNLLFDFPLYATLKLMYLGIDIGATKTLVACFTNDGVITERSKFLTPKNYTQFKKELADTVAKMSTSTFFACCVGVPGKLDRKQGIGIAMGNLPWKNVPIGEDVKAIASCPVVIENDAKLAGLSEAMLLKATYDRVAYVTISTGIGVGIIVNQRIEPSLVDSEPGKMPLEHNGKMVAWESFASGKAIVKRYGKQASEITDQTTWKHIAQDIAVGLINVIAIVQPQVIVLGGGVATHFDRFDDHLKKALQRYETPLIPIPPIMHAARPEDAVVYGCYDLAKSTYGKSGS